MTINDLKSDDGRELGDLIRQKIMVAATTGILGGGVGPKDRMLDGVGVIIDYEEEPTVTIKRPDGSTFIHRLSYVAVATDAEIIQEYEGTIKRLAK